MITERRQLIDRRRVARIEVGATRRLDVDALARDIERAAECEVARGPVVEYDAEFAELPEDDGLAAARGILNALGAMLVVAMLAGALLLLARPAHAAVAAGLFHLVAWVRR